VTTTYDALYAWTSEVFRGEPFTSGEFRDTFRSPDAKKVLSDFRRLGYVDRVARGTYRVTPPAERLRRIVAGSEVRLEVPEGSGLPHAYSEATAVAIWTDGAYWTGFTRGLRPLHLNVRRGDVGRWRRFLADRGYDSVVPVERKTLCGTVFVLHPVAEVVSVPHAGVRVVPLPEVCRFAADRPYAFGPAARVLSRRLRRRGHGGSKG
jgi:hypothetical protein